MIGTLLCAATLAVTITAAVVVRDHGGEVQSAANVPAVFAQAIVR